MELGIALGTILSDGAKLGTSLGALSPSKVGITLGTTLGTPDGAALGIVEGTALG